MTAKKGIAGELRENWQLYVLALPLAVWLILYAYKPLIGLVIAFQKFSPFKGIEGSPFVGLDNFQRLMAGPSAYMFWRALRNTVQISLYGLVFGFPIPIILAILFNEAREGVFRKGVQTVSYLPNLISEVTIASIVLAMLQLNGLANVAIEGLLGAFGVDYKRISWMSEPAFFQGIYILTGIWKNAGFDSIVFYAALVGISPTLYEAARIDGASRIQRIRYVSIPGIMPTIVIMLIIRVGNVLNVGFERVLLMYNPTIYSTADVLGTFTYRLGSSGFIDYGLSTASSMFNSLVGFALVIVTNRIARKASETSLW
ncbi:MAG: ABC transporter permease subunit [Spirochaetaceae bacterium]|nr:ABC transporter permease subunit [Spirochaetaceae bacterium]